MALPEAVQRKIDEAEKIEQDLAKGAPQDSPQADPNQPQQPPATPSQPPQPQDSAQPAAPQVDLAAKVADLEQQLNSARVEQGRVKSLSQQLAQARQQIDDLTTQLEAAKSTPPAPENTPEREELVDAYGEDLVVYMENLANGVKQDVQKVTQQFDETRRTTAETNFWDRLNRAHPDWEKMQNTDAGQKFLLSKVPYDSQGRTFDELLNTAARAYDADGAIEVFNGLKQYVTNNQPANPQDRLASQVVPGNGPGGQPESQTPKPTISTADYKRASQEYAKNGSMEIPARYGAKTLEEWDAMVNEAIVEGRMR